MNTRKNIPWRQAERKLACAALPTDWNVMFPTTTKGTVGMAMHCILRASVPISITFGSSLRNMVTISGANMNAATLAAPITQSPSISVNLYAARTRAYSFAP